MSKKQSDIDIAKSDIANRAPADREVSIKDSGFTRTGLGVTVLYLHTAT